MQDKKAAVFIMLGQSNAVGHGIPMEEKDIIKTPLNNVFGLSREYNQSFDNKELRWSGYTSFGMNLAEEQDNTYSVPNCLASLWQKHIDDGNKKNLPDLYIIQIAIGAQGVSEKFMWYPFREKKLIPGVLDIVDISLFPFSNHIFSLLDDSFKAKNIDYEIIGLHWRGGENEASVEKEYLKENLENIYKIMFDKFNDILNSPPIILHKLACPERMNFFDPSGKYLENMNFINDVFEILQNHYKNVSVFDPTSAPQFIPNVHGNGIFIEDAVHFTPEVNMWIAENVLKKYCDI
jgi:hypothetical protein